MMKEYFQTFGELEDAMVVYNRAAGVSRGFGFVTFKREWLLDPLSHLIPPKRVICTSSLGLAKRSAQCTTRAEGEPPLVGSPRVRVAQ